MTVLLNQENELKKVNWELLKPSPYNTFEVDNIEELAENIRACGLITPLSVIGPYEDGTYEIISGERRYRAICLLNEQDPPFMEDIPVYVIDDSDMDETRKKLAIELSNIETRDNINREIHRFQIVKLFKELSENGGIEIRKIASTLAKYMRTSQRYGRMYAAIFRDGTDELLQSVMSKEKDAGKGEPVHIPTMVASQISQLPPELQKTIIDRVNAGEKPLDVLNEVKSAYRSEQGPVEDDSRPSAPVKHSSGSVSPELQQYMDEDDESPDAELYSALDRAAATGEDIDLDDFEDPMGAFRRQHNHIDLNIDTAGRLKSLRSSASENSGKKVDERKIIVGWMERMNRIIDRDGTLEPEDAALLEELSQLVEKYSKVS